MSTTFGLLLKVADFTLEKIASGERLTKKQFDILFIGRSGNLKWALI